MQHEIRRPKTIQGKLYRHGDIIPDDAFKSLPVRTIRFWVSRGDIVIVENTDAVNEAPVEVKRKPKPRKVSAEIDDQIMAAIPDIAGEDKD